MVRSLTPLEKEESTWLHGLHTLTSKPVLYVCNVSEGVGGEDSPYVAAVRERAAREGGRVMVVSAKVEAEIAELPPQERLQFLESLGLKESGLSRVINEVTALLNLTTFFTVGSKEVRAWTVPAGTSAPGAAGAVHSDFERGFIRAEIIKFTDFQRLGSEHAVREHGLMHSEGREYKIQEGDIAYFRFNV
jgi:ribosome-binding ATPase YchF (GTP1/OBG family)